MHRQAAVCGRTGQEHQGLEVLKVRPRAGKTGGVAIARDARLPGERDMAEEYGVAVGTIRRAIVDLRERGLVVTLPSKGTFIALRRYVSAYLPIYIDAYLHVSV